MLVRHLAIHSRHPVYAFSTCASMCMPCSRWIRRGLPAGAGHRREGTQAQRLPAAHRGGDAAGEGAQLWPWAAPSFACPTALPFLQAGCAHASCAPSRSACLMLAPRCTPAAAAVLGPAARCCPGVQLPDGAGAHHHRHGKGGRVLKHVLCRLAVRRPRAQCCPCSCKTHATLSAINGNLSGASCPTPTS